MVVEIKNLIKRYGNVLAVDNVSMSIKEGEIFGLLGPNGAGKTTIINTIVGLCKIDKGEIRVFGKSLKEDEIEIKKNMGIVPQDIAVFEDLTAYENVKYFARLYGLSGTLLKERVEEALNFVGLWDKRKEYPVKFSGGMKRRLNIACAITHRPKLIIMDEPTVGIDPQSRNHILDSIKVLNDMGSTIIYTSHYMEEIEQICSYVVIVDHGRVIAKGTKEELKDFVSQEEKIDITLSNINFSIVDEIKKIDGVKDCIIEDNNMTVISSKNSKNIASIMEKIIKYDSDIISLNIDRPTLETVFLTLTGKKLRD
ncbi:ABC transporter ATP-binding protein [Caloramator sp. E03]|uniref:ABC transporter ATP-binding protein n=1 Tax=Caloramator sp. E03 TaxID=2576307 RepID=UPI0011108E19|nr:ABC transporter ATP-binding protein [Caloramator sp. E03]QCX33167.1 ABC transporter ATP-binding protein [Caloramator sp. E03]